MDRSWPDLGRLRAARSCSRNGSTLLRNLVLLTLLIVVVAIGRALVVGGVF
jgi:hypothetical protein